MQPSTAIAVFFLIWWIVLFAVLPWGVHRQDEDGAIAPGTDPGAPALPDLRRKLLWTTLVSFVVFAGCYVVVVERLVTLEGLLAPFGLHTTIPGVKYNDSSNG
jgi:predicted secreted protein